MVDNQAKEFTESLSALYPPDYLKSIADPDTRDREAVARMARNRGHGKIAPLVKDASAWVESTLSLGLPPAAEATVEKLKVHGRGPLTQSHSARATLA